MLPPRPNFREKTSPWQRSQRECVSILRSIRMPKSYVADGTITVRLKQEVSANDEDQPQLEDLMDNIRAVKLKKTTSYTHGAFLVGKWFSTCKRPCNACTLIKPLTGIGLGLNTNAARMARKQSTEIDKVIVPLQLANQQCQTHSSCRTSVAYTKPTTLPTILASTSSAKSSVPPFMSTSTVRLEWTSQRCTP